MPPKRIGTVPNRNCLLSPELAMGWSPETAAVAYIDTVKLCKLYHERVYSRACLTSAEPQSTEFISALAAGMNAELIVEVCTGAGPSTIALAAAARQTGGHLVCILPDEKRVSESRRVVKELGLEQTVEFVVGDAKELVPLYRNVDFVLIDCKMEGYAGLFQLLKMNSRRAVMVANNLFDRKATAAYAGFLRPRVAGARSVTLPIGKGIEVTRIAGTADHCENPTDRNTSERKFFNATLPRRTKGRWIVKIDEHSGEENLFRVWRRSKTPLRTMQHKGDTLA